MSQHIGDLDYFDAFAAFKATIADLCTMYDVPMSELLVVHDAHPEYASTQYARTLPGEHRAVQHHRAHVASVLVERKAFDTRVEMPAWSWLVIAVVAVIVVALIVIVARSASRRKRTERLKDHFGPEYDRAVGDTGDQGAAEKELVARERKRQKLDIVVLGPESRAMYAEHWRTVQTAFVDNPSKAVGDADRLADPGNARTWLSGR